MTLGQMIAFQTANLPIPGVGLGPGHQFQCQIQVLPKPDTPKEVPIPASAPLFALGLFILMICSRTSKV